MNRPLLVAAAGVATLAVAPLAHRVPPEISANALRAHVEVLAHDSMLGRGTGTVGLERATRYLVAQLERNAIAPAGDGGTYYQTVPLRWKRTDIDNAQLSLSFGLANPRYLKPRIEFLPLVDLFGTDSPDSVSLSGAARVGFRGDSTISAPRYLLLEPPQRPNGQPNFLLDFASASSIENGKVDAAFYTTLDLMPTGFLEQIDRPRLELTKRFVRLPRVPALVAITGAGVPGTRVSLSYRSVYTPLAFPARNIVAVLDGSDPVLKSEYVVLSAHIDHRGTIDRSTNGADSVYNGADANASGAAALIEIARALAAPSDRPKRSILFVWTVAHDEGLLGVEYFVDHPTVARNRLVAAISLDMIGRGGAGDIAGGGPAYLATSGERMLSSEVAAALDSVNETDPFHFSLVRSSDAPWSNRCGGDEWHFTRRGIPSVRLTTGRHRDYRQVTDDADRIDFPKFSRVTQFAATLAQRFANETRSPRIDQPRPDSLRACVQ